MPKDRIASILQTLSLIPMDEKLDREVVHKAKISQARAIQNANESAALLFFQMALSSLPDPRRPQGVRYPLRTVVVIALMATVCGADDAEAMEFWGQSNEEWLSTFLDMPHGVPTQDVYLDVLAALDPAAFNDMFRAWAEMISMQLRKQKKPARRDINVDGKESRRSYDTAKELSAIHTVSAWSRDAGIVLGQIKTEEKSNEITAIPELLKKLDIKKATITIDAMGCQTKIASLIIQGGGDYILAVKENQPKLFHDIETAFKYADNYTTLSGEQKKDALKPPSVKQYVEENQGHGRLEKRTVEICKNLSWLDGHIGKWDGLSYFVRVIREQTQKKTGKTSREVSYYIGSQADIKIKSAARSIRGHWGIETKLHWVLDMAFREDEARHRAGNAAANMATLRHFALNLIKQDKTRTLGVANCRKMAGWDRDYLIKLLIDSEGKL